MTDTNLTCILYKKGDIRVEERPVPKVEPGKVKVAVHKVGICGSDVHYWTNGGIGDFIVRAPMVLGHESAGVVVEIGDGVTDLKVGDRVALEPGVPCRRCDYCKTGRYNLCPDIEFLATPPVHGNLARYHVHPADFCFKLPDHVSLEEGALLEPISVGVHACKRAGVSLGDFVLICGAGPIGLVNLLTAKAMGAAKVCVTDIAENRLEVAKKMGADNTVLIDSKDSRAMADKIVKTIGRNPDVTIECSGAEPSIQSAIYASKRGGKVATVGRGNRNVEIPICLASSKEATKSGGMLVLVGLGPSEVTIPIVNAAVREVDIRGIFRYANCYPIALSMIASGQIDAKPLITHHFTLEESLKAFEVARTGAGGAIKVMIDCAKKDG